MEESEDGLDDWRDFVMSPKGLFSGFASEPSLTKSIPEVFGSNGGEEGILGNDHEREVENSVFDFERKLEVRDSSRIVGDDSGVTRSGGSIAERRAAKCGFNASKISTPRFRSNSQLPSPGVRSPYLTIPAGISPTALLDSPMFLPNSQSSPTTGTLASLPPYADSKMLVSASSNDADKSSVGGSSSMFKPHTVPIPLSCYHPVDSQVSVGGLAHVDCQSRTAVHPPMDFEFPVQFPQEVSMNNHDTGSPLDRKISDDLTTLQSCHSNTVTCVQMHDKNEPSMAEDSGTHNSIDGDQKGTFLNVGTVRTAEDGYNWRKYGQKQVKGSEYPRSYYKCTHPNCQVKKKVERSHDGQITEIIYKGAHNHPKPQPCRKSTIGSSFSLNETQDIGDGSSSCIKADGGSVWRHIQPGSRDVKIGADWKTDGLERTSSTSVVTDASDPLSATQGKSMGVLESAGTPEFSSTLASQEDDDEDATTQGSLSVGDDDDNEPDSKRRALREPRVVVQIESEVDILDDGYRWRKYGQKVVKGNPNPRSYYKCTSAGCTVRKHVERASHNLKYVITTYEGKHNHEVPAARNSSHATAGSGSLPPTAPNSQSALTLPRNPHLPKPEPLVHDLPPHFDTRMGGNNDFLRSTFLGNLGAYSMKFPTLPTVSPYGPFVQHHPAYHSGIMPSFPDLSLPLPLGFPRPTNLAIGNYSNLERPLSAVQPLFTGQQQLKENDVKLLRPKQEQRDDSYYEPEMHDMDQKNPSSSSLYNHM